MSLTARPLLPVTGRSVELELTPDPPFRLEEGKEYTIRCTPLSGFRRYSAGREVDTSDFAGFDRARPAVASNGRLRLDMCFPQEDEYWLRVSDGEREIGCPRVYALEPDLHACYPLKGDLHNHTYLSDGRESPAYVIAMLRKKGADFASITDHGWYQPSLEALEYWKELGTDFLVLPGEEVHAPDCRVHILSVGGRFSVNSWGYDGASDYREKLEQEKSKLPANLDEDDRTRIAASQAVFDKAREAGALSLFCHPFWETADGFDIHEDVTRYLLVSSNAITGSANTPIGTGIYTRPTRSALSRKCWTSTGETVSYPWSRWRPSPSGCANGQHKTRRKEIRSLHREMSSPP